MTQVILDDHLLRDLLAADLPADLETVLEEHEPASTNLYLYRLSRSVLSSRGGALTGGWTSTRRRALASAVTTAPLVAEHLVLGWLSRSLGSLTWTSKP